MVDGRTWTFPHPRDPARYGQVELRFAGDRVQASNSRSQSAGRYVLSDDQVCIDFQNPGWARVCYVVEDAASTASGEVAMTVVNAATGARSPLAIR